MKRHAFDPISFVLGLWATGPRADLGGRWLWPIPVVVLGLLFVISAIRRMMPEHGPASEAAEVTEPVEAEPETPGD